ncbi:type II toxin-antitoxin system Phd/YefM family antitoxin [bacterium]|nr:type II toxin-antitoxin system Phd/YefM family antitoxin [bacterium]
MKKFCVASDIIPVGEFKTGIAKYLKNIQETDHPVIITQNGRPAGVLLSPNEYDNLIHSKIFVDSVNRGLSDVESGNTFSTEEVKSKLNILRASRRQK